MARWVGSTLVALLVILVSVPVAGASGQHPRITHRPRVGGLVPAHAGVANLGWSSGNWSGYAITGSGFTSVTGSWVVPSVSASGGDSYSSAWIGIDGFNDSNLIQTGTEEDYSGGSTYYGAWWEILPAAETVIPSISVSPGDHMSATIDQNGGGTWTISLSDDSNGQSFSTTQSYSGEQTSAEWVMEAPEVNGSIATLADYGQTTFDPGTVNGGNPGLTSADGGAMVQNGTQVSTPSDPDADTDGFNAAYGATAPSPPST